MTHRLLDEVCRLVAPDGFVDTGDLTSCGIGLLILTCVIRLPVANVCAQRYRLNQFIPKGLFILFAVQTWHG